MKDPRRVTELRMLLRRSRALGTASLRVPPSRKPHAPPSASPDERKCKRQQTPSTTLDHIVRCRTWSKDVIEMKLTGKIGSASPIAQIFTPATRR